MRIAPLLCAWVVAATGAHAVVRTTAPFDLQTLFVSPGANGFYTFARERTPGEILARFNRVRRDAPLHVQSNMPGKPLLVHALERISPRTDVLPWLLVGLSNPGALIVFLVARELFHDRRAALYAAVLYLFTTLIVTNLIGINRGEVVRLWIFLACFVQLPAAALCSMLGHRAAIAALLVAAVLQVGLATATIGFVVP